MHLRGPTIPQNKPPVPRPPIPARTDTKPPRRAERGSDSDPRPAIGQAQKLNSRRVGRAPAGQSRRETRRPRPRRGRASFFTRRDGGCAFSSRGVCGTVGPKARGDGRRLVRRWYCGPHRAAGAGFEIVGRGMSSRAGGGNLLSADLGNCAAVSRETKRNG